MLVIVAGSMLAFLGMAGLAIDVGGWYGTQRHAQATADAVALAYANVMAGGGTTTTAAQTATTIATANDPTITSPSVNPTPPGNPTTVTVRITTTAPVFFAQALGIGAPNVGATSVASWTTGSGARYSLFAGSSGCANGNGITFESSGGGNSNVTGIHSNGQLVNNANSNATYTGTISSANASGTGVTPGQALCSSGSSWNSKNTTVTSSGSTALPFPVTYTKPTPGSGCTYSASSYNSSQISTPGVYCATGTNSSCQDGQSNGAGSIYLNKAVTGVELVAPCVVLDDSTGISPPSGQPLIYGTGSGTGTSVWIDANNSTIAGTIYAPSGTVEFTQNNDVATFVEAANIVIDRNNFTITGTGPMSASGGDSLTG